MIVIHRLTQGDETSLCCAILSSDFAMNLRQVLANVAARREYNKKVQQP
jgi:hypothetical protein